MNLKTLVRDGLLLNLADLDVSPRAGVQAASSSQYSPAEKWFMRVFVLSVIVVIGIPLMLVMGFGLWAFVELLLK